MSECMINNVWKSSYRTFTIWHVSCTWIASYKVILGPDTTSKPNSSNIIFFALYFPKNPPFKFLFCFSLFVTKLIIFTSKKRGISIKGKQESGWMDGVDSDAPALHHSPVISHLECVNQDSVYAQLCSPDRFMQLKIVFRGLQRQRKCKLFETVYHKDQCFKGKRL